MLRNNGYVLAKTPENNKVIQDLRRTLTVSPQSNFGFPKKQYCFLENERYFVVPKCFGIDTMGAASASSGLTDGVTFSESFAFQGALRPEQADTVEQARHQLIHTDHHSCILTLTGGSGKTVMALYLATEVVKQRTLIVVHKSFLMDQWTERIRQFCGSSVRIGKIQQGVVDIQDFTIAMIQSLRLTKYPPETFASFGFLIVDECHHASAKEFSQALFVTGRKYALGLSATPHRKDGLTKVFQWHLGSLIQPAIPETLRTARITFPAYYPVVDPNATMVQKITHLVEDLERNKFILSIITNVLKDPQRRLLVLSERRAHLQYLHDNTDHASKLLFMGGTVNKDTPVNTDLVFGTYSMACLDVNTDMIDYTTGRIRKLGAFQSTKSPVLSASGVLDIPTAFDFAPEKPCVRVTHERGTLVCSTDHRLMLIDGTYKQAQDLNSSDRLKTPDGIVDPPIFYVPPLTDDELTLIGYVYGRNAMRDVKYTYTIPYNKSSERDFLLSLLPQKNAVDVFQDHLKITNPYLTPFLEYVKVARFPADFYRLPRHLLDTLVHAIIRFNPTLEFKNPALAHQMCFYMWRLNLDVWVEKTRVKVSEHTRVFSGYFENASVMSGILCRLRHAPGSAVLSVENIDPVPLCDISMPEKNFLASGVFVHNSEGLDLKHLNTLLLATPRSDIAQSSWRVFRGSPDIVPWIIDVQDKADLFYAQARKRRRFYESAFVMVDGGSM